MPKNNVMDFVSAFAEEASELVDLHRQAKEAAEQLIKTQKELMAVETEKTEAARAKAYDRFAELQIRATELQDRLNKQTDAAIAAKQKDILTAQKVNEMQTAFYAKLDEADTRDVDKMMPLIAQLREIARGIEARNSQGFQAVKDLNLAMGNVYVPPRDINITTGVRAMMTSRTYQERIGADTNVRNPAFVEL